jgi:hypothetical protein
MERTTERTVGHLLGLIGGLLIVVGGLVAIAFGTADLVLSRWASAAGAVSEAIVLWVVGGLVLLFSHYGEHAWSDRPVTTGLMLVVLAVVGWAVLGLGSNVVALIGGILALVAGILYLIEPTTHVRPRRDELSGTQSPRSTSFVPKEGTHSGARGAAGTIRVRPTPETPYFGRISHAGSNIAPGSHVGVDAPAIRARPASQFSRRPGASPVRGLDLQHRPGLFGSGCSFGQRDGPSDPGGERIRCRFGHPLRSIEPSGHLDQRRMCRSPTVRTDPGSARRRGRNTKLRRERGSALRGHFRRSRLGVRN